MYQPIVLFRQTHTVNGQGNVITWAVLPEVNFDVNNGSAEITLPGFCKIGNNRAGKINSSLHF